MLKRVLPFILTLMIGTALGSLLGRISLYSNEPKSIKPVLHGSGYGGCKFKRGSWNTSAPLRILSGLNTRYASGPEMRDVDEVVRLRVVFGANGQVSEVEPLTIQSKDLTEEAVEAATQIQFVPATINGQPVSVTKELDFSKNGLYEVED